jgi:hypothetical protein
MNPKLAPTGFPELVLYFLDTVRERGGHYQLIGVLVLVAGAYLLWRLGFTRTVIDRVLASGSRRTALVVLVILGASFVIFSLPTIVTRKAVTPMSSDEYGFLLIADTFRHGRLTNPPHPLWKHFENFYILQQPTYTSKYWPAQAAAMAAGWIAFGHPIHGVRLSGALACLAVFWMMCGWFDRRWALVGALLAATSFVVFDWNQTYLGGDVALLAGALCLGAVIRLVRVPRGRDAAILGVGLAILSNSRPFEGLIFGLCLGTSLLWSIVVDGRHRFGLPAIAKRIVIPLALVMAADLGWFAVYNAAVTGDPFTIPYALYIRRYEAVPLFLFQRPLTPLAPTCAMVAYNDAVISQFRTFQTFDGWAIESSRRLLTIGLTLISVGALPFFVVGVRDFLRSRAMLLPLVVAISTVIAISVFPFEPYYFAHVVPAILILTVAGIRSLAGGPFIGLVGPLLPVAQLVAILLFAAKQGVAPSTGPNAREGVETRLQALDGRHLVVVKEDCSPANWGFVYNDPDIDAAKIVWAKDLGAQDNAALLAYFRDRRIWLLEIERGETRLGPFSAGPIARPPSGDSRH